MSVKKSAVVKNIKDSKIAESAGRRPVVIPPPKIRTVHFKLIGTAPYVQLRFSQKVKAGFMEKFTSDAPASKKRVHKKRDMDQDFQDAMYISEQGWHGVHAGSFRAAMVSACRLVNFKMTLAKLSIFIPADGIDKLDGTPLIRIHGEPERSDMIVRNANGQPDLRTRAMWRKWSIELHVQFDEAQFSVDDVANLVSRVGMQVGIGEGRPDSKSSVGMGWGTFELEQK